MSENVKSKLESYSFRLMKKDEFRAFGELAGRAYSTDYPVYPYYFGESSTKEKIVSIFQVNYRSLFKVGTAIYSFDDSSLGNAAIVPAGTKKVSTMNFVVSGGWKWFFTFGPKAVKRLLDYEAYCNEIMDKYADENTWYFQNFTVAAGHQGQGLGGKMISPILEHLDEIGASCYLETHTRKNVGFYEHYGFELVEVGHLPNSDIEHYAMLRRPKKFEN